MGVAKSTVLVSLNLTVEFVSLLLYGSVTGAADDIVKMIYTETEPGVGDGGGIAVDIGAVPVASPRCFWRAAMYFM